MDRSSELWEPQEAPTSVALTCRVEEPSTASGGDIAPPSAQTGNPHILKFDYLLIGAAMKLPRRQFLRLAAGAAALPVVSRATWAQTYPTKPVRMRQFALS